MDNLGAHRPKRVRGSSSSGGDASSCICRLTRPTSIPSRKPSEEVKHILRKIRARTKEALIEAMGRALEAVSARDVEGFFVHCGYCTPAQQL